jgi:hypothetical protein
LHELGETDGPGESGGAGTDEEDVEGRGLVARSLADDQSVEFEFGLVVSRYDHDA